ncbi:MAG: hypothetical protein WBF04_01260 [Candidatus Sulfotelmatobacter sp.]
MAGEKFVEEEFVDDELVEEESEVEESDESAAKITAPSTIKEAQAQSKRKPPDINTSCRNAGSKTAAPAGNHVLRREWESQPQSVSETTDAIVGNHRRNHLRLAERHAGTAPNRR